MAWGDLPVESRTLDPLAADLRSGLTAITVLAFISFFAATTLFVYLVYKLASWHFFIQSKPNSDIQQTRVRSLQRAIDFTLGIGGIFADNNQSANGDQGKASAVAEPQDAMTARRHPNQFLVLIINLLLADMHQGVAFFLNAEWLRRDSIVVDAATCYTQGLFVSLGDLASSMFITAIAIHTYLSVVSHRRIPPVILYLAIAAVWVFIYAISFIPIAATSNGAEHGGFFVRAGTWCWINRKYENLRFFTHYLFIFIGFGTTSILYTIIFLFIRRQARSASTSENDDSDTTQLQLNRNSAFLIYPVIYVLCTLPLATGRIATMAGVHVPNGYFCFAGAMIACNGLFDCLLFGTTRNAILFAPRDEIDILDVGLHTFAFMKTSANRPFGNIISIEGGRNRANVSSAAGGWWECFTQRIGIDIRSGKAAARTASQESLRSPAIQMDTVTSVVVEVDDTEERDPRYPNPTSSSNPSLNSTKD
ncbi:hypothetical protein ACKLNR_014255 [Fusarium oxysporum f. sp. zingiberi]